MEGGGKDESISINISITQPVANTSGRQEELQHYIVLHNIIASHYLRETQTERQIDRQKDRQTVSETDRQWQTVADRQKLKLY